MTRIAQLSFYPTLYPIHGGQIRAHHIARALEAAGHEIIRLPFFCTGHHPEQRELPIIDLSYAIEQRRYPQIHDIADLTLCGIIATDDDYFAAFAEAMDEARPDIVMLEEPWMWPAVKRWLNGRANPPPVVFNSYNVEAHAKAGILADRDDAEAGAVVAEIEALERDLVQHAAAVTATTEGDAQIFRAWTDRPIAVARNGTAARVSAQLRGVLPAPLKPAQPYLLFVGSGHPPNAAGFLSMVMPALPRLRSNERIVLAGGVCNLVSLKLAEHGPNALVRDRAVFLGQVSGQALECLITNASGMLLPITYGGGSNLKTAEALSSGLPIVGTSIAFRGFEEYQDLPQVRIADTPEAFAQAVQHMLQTTHPPRQDLMVKELHWETTLRPIVELVNHVAAGLAPTGKAGVLA
jgi:glycosyltransferase involved in cell wall biosynthesis